MSDIYRFKFSSGSFDIELESTDKKFIEEKMFELIGMNQSPIQTNSFLPKPENLKDESVDVINNTEEAQITENSITESGFSETEDDDTKISANEISNAINESPDLDKIEEKILDRSNNLNKIILILYFIDKLQPGLSVTTGLIEEVTDQLGVKILRSNAGTKIKDNQKYFSADDVRKKGAIVHYKLNRNGKKYFEELVNG